MRESVPWVLPRAEPQTALQQRTLEAETFPVYRVWDDVWTEVQPKVTHEPSSQHPACYCEQRYNAARAEQLCSEQSLPPPESEQRKSEQELPPPKPEQRGSEQNFFFPELEQRGRK